MDELLQKLLEAEVLSPETKKDLETAFKAQLDSAIEAAKTDAANDVRASLTEQYVTEREALIEAVDTKVAEFLDAEIAELKEDIERFRDLEAEYAQKIVEAKSAMADELKDDLTQLVEKLDAFLEVRLSTELDELRTDVQEVRKVDFGRKVFEAFVKEFVDNYADPESAEATLRESEQKIVDLEASLADAQRARAELERGIKLDTVLEPLSGKSREVMEMLLKNISTEKLEEAYKTFIGRVLRESTEVAKSEKEGKVLAEGASEEKGSKPVETIKEKVFDAVIATGDDEDVINESVNEDHKKLVADLKRLAGVK